MLYYAKRFVEGTVSNVGRRYVNCRDTDTMQCASTFEYQSVNRYLMDTIMGVRIVVEGTARNVWRRSVNCCDIDSTQCTRTFEYQSVNRYSMDTVKSVTVFECQ